MRKYSSYDSIHRRNLMAASALLCGAVTSLHRAPFGARPRGFFAFEIAANMRDALPSAVLYQVISQ